MKDKHSPGNPNPLLAQTRTLMRQFGLRARKGLGQHFLIDPAALESSISAAELSPEDVVIEVGPGLGVLTEKLAESVKRVVAIEIDPQITSALNKRFSKLSNITVLNTDVLRFSPSDYFKSELDSRAFKYKLVANLPYYVAAPTIRHFLEAELKPHRMVVMVQKEVAESIAAVPGKMSILGVSVQFYGKPSIVDYVPAGSFYPAPKVNSAIVRIDVYDRPVVEVETEGFFRVVRAGFSSPRKQLRNALAQGLSVEPTIASGLLDEAGILSQRRAETLNLEEWARLYEVVGLV
ncbi:MAG: 16S rRNA (adenine(1518)-N(6)/adenine(1519)-N(6))-dimethyltransferase RsmA [Chloroflexota bacterium]|nr:16S rRNA (adenine(1518)-N(6)/adenine(1519)-N(6))-dimethyltransferase RsmA [Chloroflexota bacterium]